MNRGELLEHIGFRLVELKGAEGLWSAAEREGSLDICHLEMTRDLKLLRGVAIANTSINTQNVSITAAAPGGFGLSNFLDVIPASEDPDNPSALVYDDGAQDALLIFTTLEELYAARGNWRYEPAGTPAYYFPPEGGALFNDLIGLYPKPVSSVVNALRLHHLKKPAAMTADSHQPFNVTAGSTIQFPALIPIHYGLVWKVVWKLIGDSDEGKARLAAAYYAGYAMRAESLVKTPETRRARSVRVARGYRYGRSW